ncbi:MAG: DUF6603 domain-containing protein [Acidimicrobiales bacterium]
MSDPPPQVIDDEVPPIPKPVKKQKDPGWWQHVTGWFVDAYDWLEKLMTDPEAVRMLQADLGLAVTEFEPGEHPPLLELQGLRAFAEGTDVTAEAIAATVEQWTVVIEAALSLVSVLDDDAENDDQVWELFRKILAIYATETVRARDPLSHSIFKMAGVFTEQFGHVDRLDIDRFADLFADRSYSAWDWNGFDSYRATQFSDLFTFVFQQVLMNVVGILPGWIDSYYGWDTPPDQMFRQLPPDPADPTAPPELVRRADTGALERMWTVFFRSDPNNLNSGGLLLTFALVPEEHGGPGIVLSLGGTINLSQVIDDHTLSMRTTSAGALNAFIGFTDEAKDSEFDTSFGDLNQTVDIAYRPLPAQPGQADEPRKPAILIGSSDGVHMEIQQLGIGAQIQSDLLAAQLDLIDGKLVVPKGSNSLLDQLIRKDLSLEFELGLRLDNHNGLHLTNGSGLHTLVPLNRTVFGVTVHYVEVGFQAPQNKSQALEFFATTAVSVQFGSSVKALAERFGYRQFVTWGDGNRSFDSGFQPPKGISISVNAGAVKGGGYLFIDPDKNEYRGVFELTFSKFALKGIGILTTEVPGRPGDWALIALITFEFPPWGPIAGVGGILGVHHGLSIEKLQSGIRTGVLDSILFPKDPTANPAQVINHIRTVFPLTPGALTIGLMLKLTFGGGALQVLLGLLVQWDNAIGNGDGSASLSRMSVIGRLQITVPAEAKKPKVKIILDVAGSYDFPGRLLSIDGRLRNSKLGSFSITGTGSARRQDHVAPAPGVQERLPSQVVTIGGWHPRFKDIPAGIPKQDRFGFSLKSKKGAKTKYEVSVKAYYADTPNTRQIGIAAKAKVSRWGFTLEAWLSFDGIWYTNPDYFELDFKIGASVKKGSRTLMTVDLEVHLLGPGYWILSGKAKVKVLFFSKTISFHEEWGTGLPPTTEETDVEAQLEAALQDPRNWNAELPSSSEMLVTLRGTSAAGEVLSHPLGGLSFTQQVVPLGIEIDRLGAFVPSGASRFEITDVTVGGNPETTVPLTSYFSRSEFLDLTNEEKLTLPSFEAMEAGHRITVDEDGLSSERVSAEPGYEVKYRGRPTPKVPRPPRTHVSVAFEMVSSRAKMKTTSGKRIGRNHFAGRAATAKVRVVDPPLAIATTDTFEQVEGVVAGSHTAAGQAITDPKHQVVEAHELETVS